MQPHLLRKSLEEELSLVPLKYSGHIPSWLQGTLIRNGPAKFEAQQKPIAHWFDGLAMLHAFTFHIGQVTYSNRFLRTYAYEQFFEHNSINFTGFAADPCRSLFKRLMSVFFPSDKHELQNANVNVAKFADAFVALTETPLPVQFDPKTLETLGVLCYQDQLPKDNCWEAAHPHTDAKKQEIISYLLKFGPKGSYVIYRMRADSTQREVIGEIPVAEPSYMHSFALTENYVILTEFPFVINPLAPLLKGKGFIQNYVWRPELGTVFTVVHRETGDIVCQSKCDPFFAFHHVNAYEQGDTVVMDLIAYQDASIITALFEYGYGVDLDAFPRSTLERFELNLNTHVINRHTLFNASFELPRIHAPTYEGRPYRYIYGVDLREARSVSERRNIYKIDVDTQEVLSWAEPGCYPGEAVFVPSGNDRSEDDGVVLSVILDENTQQSFLLILDASTFKELGRAMVPHHIQAGLHGQYFGTF